jgi:hypothetical protein
LQVNEVLERFTAIDPRKAELMKLRSFVGMNFGKTAAALGTAVPQSGCVGFWPRLADSLRCAVR